MSEEKESVDDNFLTKGKFSKLVEEVVFTKNLSYIDAIIHLCEENQIDIEDSKKYVSTVIKSKIEAEAKRLNYLPRTNELPFE